MTTRFVSAAALMARVLGFAGYEFAVIDHPISSADDDVLRGMAVAAAGQVSRLLIEQAGPLPHSAIMSLERNDC